jgi:hypothetical protein
MRLGVPPQFEWSEEIVEHVTLTCERCGGDCDALILLEDETERSTGYRGSEEVCEACYERMKR